MGTADFHPDGKADTTKAGLKLSRDPLHFQMKNILGMCDFFTDVKSFIFHRKL